MGTLTERIERRKDDAALRSYGLPTLTEIEKKLPEWRRRALEQQERLGNVAVTDLTDRSVA